MTNPTPYVSRIGMSHKIDRDGVTFLPGESPGNALAQFERWVERIVQEEVERRNAGKRKGDAMKLTATLDDLLRDLPKILAAGVEVTEVEVSDKEPHQTGFEGMAWYDEGFSWDDERDERQDVPTAVFSNLPPCDEEAPAKFYPTEAEARKALSDAVIAWARQQNQQQQ